MVTRDCFAQQYLVYIDAMKTRYPAAPTHTHTRAPVNGNYAATRSWRRGACRDSRAQRLAHRLYEDCQLRWWQCRQHVPW